MATPTKGKNGSYTLMVRFNLQRRNLTLGKIDDSVADAFASNIDILISHCKHSPFTIPAPLKSWVESLVPRHVEQLTDVGLLEPLVKKGEIVMNSEPLTVRKLIEKFLTHYDKIPNEKVGPSTKKAFRSAMKSRVTNKLKDTLVSKIEPEFNHRMPNSEPSFSDESEAILLDFASWQRNHYTSATWSKDNKRLKQIGRWAVKKGLCHFNPFSPLTSPGEVTDSNVDIREALILDVVEHCLDPDTRLTFILGRFAGLRTPKEARTIKPEHVDFENRTLTILDCKSKKLRKMPLFDRLYDEFILHRSQSEWDRYVLSTRYRTTADANNWDLMKDAVLRSGNELWPDLRKNLRSSAINMFLEQGFPEWKVCLWVGNSTKTSRKHYQKQFDRHRMSDVEQQRQSQ